MQLTLGDDEAQVLAETVKGRINALLMSIARADSRSYKDQLIAEGGLLEGIYEKLGCAHDEWSEAKSCGFEAAKKAE